MVVRTNLFDYFWSTLFLLLEEHSRWLCFLYRRAMFYPPRPLLQISSISHIIRALFCCCTTACCRRVLLPLSRHRKCCGCPSLAADLLQVCCCTTVSVVLVAVVKMLFLLVLDVAKKGLILRTMSNITDLCTYTYSTTLCQYSYDIRWCF